MTISLEGLRPLLDLIALITTGHDEIILRRPLGSLRKDCSAFAKHVSIALGHRVVLHQRNDRTICARIDFLGSVHILAPPPSSLIEHYPLPRSIVTLTESIEFLCLLRLIVVR